MISIFFLFLKILINSNDREMNINRPKIVIEIIHKYCFFFLLFLSVATIFIFCELNA
jgi:hypothetical protein